MRSINLEQPIFVFYLNVTNKLQHKVIEEINHVVDKYTYDNITTWVIPIQGESRIECIYNTNDNISKLISKISNIINTHNIYDLDLKVIIRDLKIENLLEAE